MRPLKIKLHVWCFKLNICLLSTFMICLIWRTSGEAAPVFTIKPDHVFSKGRLFYRDLSFDHSTSSLYVGAMNTFYKLWAKNINDTSSTSQFLEREIPPNDQSVMNCAYKSRDQETQCQNYLRVFSYNSGDNTLLVCGTNAYSPIVYKINANNLHILDSNLSGAAICAVGPNDNTTALWVEPNFVGSFDIGDQYVYFFFRETAVEFINCGKAVYSRVARICKKDVGGKFVLKQNWATFLKARLNCSIPGEFPFYFDEIQDVVQTTDKTGEIVFYATFTTNLNGLYGSAVCAYSLKTINEVFDSGTFKDQASSSSVWLPVLPDHVPTPRPGQCVGDTKSISDTTLHFIKVHPLMDTTIPTIGWKSNRNIVNKEINKHKEGESSIGPIFYKRDVIFTKIIVDKLTLGNMQIFVIFVATDQGEILKLARTSDTDHAINPAKLLSVYKLPHQDPIRSMQITTKEFLYVSQDATVSQLSLPKQCHNYHLCSSCSIDPYCVWDSFKDRCLAPSSYDNFHNTNRFVKCQTKMKTNMKLAFPGETLYFDCQVGMSGLNLNSDKVTWLKNNRPLDSNLHRHFRTIEGGLVIVNISSVDSGQYECVSQGQVLTVYKLKVNDVSCDMPQNVQSYKAVYKEWCREFQEYKYKMDEWSRQRNDQLQCVSQNGAAKNMASQTFNVQLTGKTLNDNAAGEKKR